MTLLSRIAYLFIPFLLAATVAPQLSAQENILRGRVTDTAGVTLRDVNIFIPATGTGSVSDINGQFRLALPEEPEQLIITFSYIGYMTDTLLVRRDDTSRPVNIILRNEVVGIEGVSVMAPRSDNITAITIPALAGMVIPSVSGGIETAVTTLPGVSSYSELSHSYSVRGGSYDENLIYINDIEVYRPYLIRAGQQEGLSSINPDLTGSVSFSPGGFSASYGDRMSSVLDIRYREPQTSEGSASLSLLTSSVHWGTRSQDDRFYLLAGARYRSNTLLLSTLDTKGQYSPRFADIQAISGYKCNERINLTLSLWVSSNRYTFVPKSQTTRFGTIEESYKLFAWFEGGERDSYENAGGALTMNIRHNDRISSRFIVTGYASGEWENYDIRGAYSLSSLDRNEGSENNPDTLLNAGVGSWLSHARNQLTMRLLNLSYKASATAGTGTVEWGFSVKHRKLDFNIIEWLRVDSAGFTIRPRNEELVLTSYTDRDGKISSFIAESWIISRMSFSVAGRLCDLNAGLRSIYDTYNYETIVSPRVSLSAALSPTLQMYVAGGAYHQPPGGREMMFLEGNLSKALKAQRSYHLTAGLKYDFIAWGRPFKFTAEAYGKIFNRLIPYTIDNVRLIYHGGNVAKGYAAGLDLRVNGEFVQGVESWFSLSLLKSEISVPSSNSGWFPAPFDQRVNFSVFFQDYLPGRKDFRAHINIEIGTGLPASPPGADQWDIWFRMPPYRRVDIGFSKVFSGGKVTGKGSPVKQLSAGLELFNLADIRNTISYTWIRSVRNMQGESRGYAVPNYLTGRSLNIRLIAQF